MLDTNVLVSAFLWQGTPNQLIALATDGQVQLFTSRTLLDELREVLHRKKFAHLVQASGLSADELVKQYQRLVYRVSARKFIQQISRDFADDAVLVCALAAQADLIVSGDRDLLVLQAFHSIPIVNPAQVIQRNCKDVTTTK